MNNEHFTETAPVYTNADDAYKELSKIAKELLSKCYTSTLCSPLQYCRLMQESATGNKYSALLEVERYLINE